MNCDIQISIDNQRIVRVKEANFLGVITIEILCKQSCEVDRYI